jgi:hypothetical protein
MGGPRHDGHDTRYKSNKETAPLFGFHIRQESLDYYRIMLNSSIRSMGPALMMLLLLATATTINAFVVQQRPFGSSVNTVTTPSSYQSTVIMQPTLKTSLLMGAADESSQTETDQEAAMEEEEVPEDDDEEVTEITSSDEDSSTITDEEAEANEKEDAELVAMKEQIASLEGRIKETRRQAMLVADQADEFTKGGYARKVAEMENMRRNRSVCMKLYILYWILSLYHWCRY